MSDELEKLLKEPLDTENPMVLHAQLSAAEAWQYIVSSRYRGAEAELARFKRQNMVFERDESGNKMTEDTRKIRLAGLSADLQETASTLGDVADILKRRISLGQTLAKSMQTEQQSGLR